MQNKPNDPGQTNAKKKGLFSLSPRTRRMRPQLANTGRARLTRLKRDKPPLKLKGENMKVIEGNLVAEGIKVAIVASRFNEFITTKLIGGAEDTLLRHGVKDDDIELMWVPGAFEIPLMAKKAAESGKYDAVICLGAVIRGATSHYEFVAAEVSKGIALASLDSGVPVLFGVLTTENIEQAIERAGTKAGNKGADCASSAIEMVNLIRQL